MESKNKYIPLVFLIPILIQSIIHPPHFSLGLLGLFIVILFLFGFFLYLEKSMERRVRNFEKIKDRRILYMLSFSILIGLPLSLIIIWTWKPKIQLLYSLLFIALPTILIMGWAGLMEWKECRRQYFKLNGSQEVKNAA
jgi:hypothetical protein